MPPIDGLIFAGYRSFDAGADDPFRIKWNAVRPLLELPAGAEIPALTMPAISGFNADINQRIIYTPEPDSGDAWQTPAQTLAILHGDCEDYAILKYATLLRPGYLPPLCASSLARSYRSPATSRMHGALLISRASGMPWTTSSRRSSRLPNISIGFHWRQCTTRASSGLAANSPSTTGFDDPGLGDSKAANYNLNMIRQVP
jgi:hypothetical protein